MKELLTTTLTAMLALTCMAQESRWEREVYREIDLSQYANQGLYSPIKPENGRQGIFTGLFTRVLDGSLDIYAYTVNGNETFSDGGKARIEDVLEAYSIPYSKEDGKNAVKAEDYPSPEITRYYVRERHWFDESCSSFRTEVTALCPVIERSDGLQEGLTRYPMFWILMEDARDVMMQMEIIADYRNTQDVMKATDYFTLRRYKGDIYMERNPMAKALYGTSADSLAAIQGDRMERELDLVKSRTFDTYHGTTREEPKAKKRWWPFRSRKTKDAVAEMAGETTSKDRTDAKRKSLYGIVKEKKAQRQAKGEGTK